MKNKTALILVDLQNDFCKHGALEVPDGDAVVPIANRLLEKFDVVVATQDFHPANHGSFAANHPWRKPGQVIDLEGLPQLLWPIHCVEHSFGAEFVRELHIDKIHHVFPKGTNPNIDSYSGFFDNGHRAETGLGAFLKQENVKQVFVLGLATDYCVKFTALDALGLDFETFLIEDACRGVNLQPNDVKETIELLQNKGVHIVQSAQFL